MSVFSRHGRERFFQTETAFDYAWDDWRCTDYFYFNLDSVDSAFTDVSFLGCRGFIIAASELVALKMAPMVDTIGMTDYLDAAWVSILEDGLCDYAVIASTDWQGPRLGPMWCAMMIVNDALFEAVEDGGIRERCSYIHNLLLHILSPGQRAEYQTWMVGVINRLRKDHPRLPIEVDMLSPVQPMGAPCAPETFILEHQFDPVRSKERLTAHRQQIPDTNRWLRTTPLRGIVG